MNCKQAYDDIALYVGNDLSDEAGRRLEKHLKKCSSCNQHHQKMRNSWNILQKSSDSLIVDSVHDSVWPEVSVKLAKSRNGQQKFNGWIPAAAVLAASFVVFLVSDPSLHNPDNTVPAIRASFNANPLPGIQNILSADEAELKRKSDKKNDKLKQHPSNNDSENKFFNLINPPSK